MPSISIIGVGRVGGALAIALARSGYAINRMVHRGSATAELISGRLPSTVVLSPSDSLPDIRSDIVLITTADPDIEEAAHRLQSHLQGRPVVLHTSGSLSSAVLSNLKAAGCPTGSMHPLISISDAVAGAETFVDAYFCIEGDEAAQASAKSIVAALGGHAFSIRSEDKPLYHAAAVMACGHLVAVIDAAIEMLSECGIDPKTARAILLPLIKSTITNLETQAPSKALTGTFARADVAAFERHLAAIDKSTSGAIRDIYLLLGERSLDLAEANGASPENIEKLRKSISIAKRKLE